MQYLYNSFVYLAVFLLKTVALFNSNIKEFVLGRRGVFKEIKSKINNDDLVFWIHAASLGEFEQGRPVIETLKKEYPQYKIVLTFFSPSGYKVRKKYELADLVCYLPMDTLKNTHKFIKALQPTLAIFIKYEFWPNYLYQLKKHNIPTFLISGIFRENQIFFKPYGFWIQKSLKAFSHFFVQDKVSEKLLKSINIDPVTVAGDTRFDRVQQLTKSSQKLPFVSEFKNNTYLLVAGSTWQEDEVQLVSYINNFAKEDEKFIIAPHNIKAQDVKSLKESINKPTVLFSEKQHQDLRGYQVMIVDTVGILSKIYADAEVVYIGGGYTKSGVHNTLEAATYGLPLVVGPNYVKFKEVKDLVSLKGCTSVSNTKDLVLVLETLKNDKPLRLEQSFITKQYIATNLGATQKIVTIIKQTLNDKR